MDAGEAALFQHSGRSRFLEELAASVEAQSAATVLCVLDIDKFRFLNAVVGSQVADLALQQIFEVLRGHLGPETLIGRTGDDEFSVLLSGGDLPKAHAQTVSLMEALARYQLDWCGQVFRFTACAGLTVVSQSQTAADALHAAMTACCAAKDISPGSIVVADEAEKFLTRHYADARILTGLQSAMAVDRLRLYAQEIFSLDPAVGTTLEFELLVHMVDADGTEFPPSAIIPAAERHGYIRDLDRWVMKAALLEHADLLQRNRNITLSLNLSGQSLADPTLWPYVSALFAESAVSASRIQFEITETSAISDMSVAMSFVQSVRALGCRVALDDFGSGLSSFVYLRTFPVDCIKIDGAFVANVTDAKSTDRAIVSAIVGVARDLQLTVVAEHVDSAEILATLRKLGVHKVQGYLIAEPRPFREMFEKSSD
ncbi:EAL domain-containing protein [Pseudotabrizicola sp. 4114]|uniref:EAL domain-containing protein n=1 Tax=Pseudotabrizicola sp. 4114 TaxID=2817731 RepID=UPI002861F2EE|nr:diguanylate cyclase (GGDEF)-like protein [Pseudorhodobacter sp. 4114]